MTILEIIKKYLEDRGFDGLYHKWGCKCLLDDLLACNGASWDIQYCQPGYKQACKCGEDCGFHIGAEREAKA